MSGTVISGTRSISREELQRNAARAATGFRALGVAEGDAVAVMLRNDFPYFEVQMAGALAGHYTVPVNWHYKQEEAGYIIRDSGAKALIIHADLLPQVEGAVPAGVHVLAVETPPEVAATYGISDQQACVPEGVTEWAAWRDRHAPWSAAPARPRGTMTYTSGSTGRPKGVRRELPTDQQVAATARSVGQVARISPTMRTVITGPLYHSMPNAYGIFAVREGELVVLQPRFDAEGLLALIEQHRITHLYCVPTMFVRLLRLPEAVKARHDVSSLEWVFHTAAPCPPDVKQAMIDWWGPVIAETYAGTEIGLITLATSEEFLARRGTVGQCLPDATLCIRDEAGQLLPAGEPGLIYARSAALADFTYHGQDARRREIEIDGLITLGDVGYLDEDGYLFLCDRQVDMVISGGVNIYPVEIEGVIMAHPDVRDCAVFGIPDEEFGESLAAVVQLQDGAAVSEEALRAHIAAALAGYKVPRLIEFRADLPREDTGKLFKRLLREPYWKDAGRAI